MRRGSGHYGMQHCRRDEMADADRKQGCYVPYGHLIPGVLCVECASTIGKPYPDKKPYEQSPNTSKTQSKRILHTLVSITTTVSFIIYMALATGQGITYKHEPVLETHKHVPNTTDHHFRQILWLRYVNWFITNPLSLINLALLSGLPGANLLVAIVGDFVLLSSGVFGTFTKHPSVRWVWFVICVVGYLVTIYQFGVHGTRAASNKDTQRKRFYSSLMGVTLLVRVLFPMCVPITTIFPFICSLNSETDAYSSTIAAGSLSLKLGLDAETVLFAIQDIFLQGILGYWLLIAHDSAIGT